MHFSNLNPKRPNRASSRARSGFTLVEVSLALGIVSFCVVGLMGLFLAAFNGEQTATDQVSAMELMSALTSDINAPATTVAGVAQTPHYAIQLPSIGTTTPVTSTFWVGDNLEPVSPTNTQKFAVTYVVTAPTTSYGSYQFFLRVYNAAKAQTAAASLAQTSFTESVISKSAQ